MTPRPVGWLAHWWARRTVRFRITVIAIGATGLCLLLLARLGGGLIGTTVQNSVDTGLRRSMAASVAEVAAGRAPRLAEASVDVRVLDTSGAPVDGGAPPELSVEDVRALKEGVGITHQGPSSRLRRWVGTVATTPDGTPRLVVAETDLFGYLQVLQWGGSWLVIAGLLSLTTAGIATWLAVRWSLRPVEKLRLAAGALAAGSRLPVPQARDELRALSEALNALLVRRDEAAERLRRFTGDAAHELRSPVASIRAQAEVAVIHPNPEYAQEVLQAIVGESERLSDLVDNLLALARSDAGRQAPAEPVDVVDAVHEAVGRLDGGPRVRIEAPSPLAVLASPGEVSLVLDNVLRNAARYARALIRVWVLPSGGMVRLMVDDDGPGVPEEHRHRIFDRFYRADDDRGRRTGGAGLGLALVAEIVRGRGGAVRVGDSPDGGARFVVLWRRAG